MKNSEKIRVLFFAWGYSIHARRRIEIFTNDPSFEVGVISNYDYKFANAKNYFLAEIKNSDIQKKHALRVLLKISTLFFWISFLGRIQLSELLIVQKNIFLVRKYTKLFKPNIIFLQTLLYPCYLSYVINRKIPILTTFWNGDLTWWAKWKGIERLFKKWIVRYGIKRSKIITVNSQEAFNECLKYNIKANKIHLIRYPGVDFSLFNTTMSQSRARRELNLTSNEIILCPRGLGDYLNSEVILEAAKIIIDKHPNILFVFLTTKDNVYLESHKQKTLDLNISKNVHFVEGVQWEDMPKYYRSADVMVSISSNDSLPNCMIESMACGIPLIISDIPQIREWIEEGKNGFLVDPLSNEDLALKIKSILLMNNKIINRMIEKNLKIVKDHFDSNINSKAIKDIVKKMINIQALGEK